MNRETIYAALWNVITTAPGIAGQFKTTGRLARQFEEVSVDEMPALFLLQQGETWVRKGKGMPAIRTLNSMLLFYVATADPTAVLPATLLNNAMDAIDTLFNTPPGQVQTLGGLIEHAYIAEGEVRFYEGLLQEKSPATVPIRMLVP